MSAESARARASRRVLAVAAALAACLALAACGGDDTAGPAGGTGATGGATTGTATAGGSTDILDDAKLGRDIGVSIRDTGLAVTGLAGCGRSLSCYRGEGAEIARFAQDERAQLAPRIAGARTGCVRATGELHLDLLTFLESTGTGLETANFQDVITSSTTLARRAGEVTGVARGCADVVIP